MARSSTSYASYPEESGPSEAGNLLTYAAVGLVGLWLYDKIIQSGGVGNAFTSLAGQLAPITASSATFPPQAAPSGYYWSPQPGGGYALAPLTNVYGITGTQQSVITGLSGLVGGLVGSIFGTSAGGTTTGIPSGGVPTGNYNTTSFTSSAQPYYGNSSQGTSSSLYIPPLDTSLNLTDSNNYGFSLA